MSNELSSHDQEILNNIFSQELYNVQSVNVIKTVPQNRKLTDAELEAAELEVEAIKLADTSKDYARSLELFASAMKLAPAYPSPYNNRAQVLRLLKQDQEAFSDLDQAIKLCLSDGSLPLVLRQAYCQRAWLRYNAGQFEDAFVDFEEASKLGSSDAKKMAVKCNPYAQLCNNIMQEMLQNLYYSNPNNKDKGH